MGIRGDSFDDDSFRKTLEKVVMKMFQIKKRDQDECDPHYSVLIGDVLSKDVNDHPIDCFHEVLACLRMHPAIRDSSLLKTRSLILGIP